MVNGIRGVGAAHQGELPTQAQGLALGLARKAAATGAVHGGGQPGHHGRPDAGPDAIVTISHEGKRLADAARHAASQTMGQVEGGALSGAAGSTLGHRVPHGIAKKLTGVVGQAASVQAVQAVPAPTPIRALGASLRSPEGSAEAHGRAWGRRLHAGELGSWSSRPRKAADPMGPASIHEIVQRAAVHTVDKAHRDRAAQAGAEHPAHPDHPAHPATPTRAHADQTSPLTRSEAP